jgi:hypothetical protein
MKKHRICGILFVMLLLSNAAWAAEKPALSDNVPDILASLDPGSATILDDQAAKAIRGQGYQYVLVKILGINALDFGPGVQWSWNPLGFRYGAWGGPGWTNGGDPADAMDALFMAHDNAYSAGFDKLAADQLLVSKLKGLATSNGGYWGQIYISNPTDLNAGPIYVSGASFIGGKIFLGWRAMPYTEYARREALAGLGVMILGRSLANAIRLQ